MRGAPPRGSYYSRASCNAHLAPTMIMASNIGAIAVTLRSSHWAGCSGCRTLSTGRGNGMWRLVCGQWTIVSWEFTCMYNNNANLLSVMSRMLRFWCLESFCLESLSLDVLMSGVASNISLMRSEEKSGSYYKYYQLFHPHEQCKSIVNECCENMRDI
jgi:hypothetical protein